MNLQQAAFDHLQQRIKRIESRQESQHEEMMAYLRSMFPPPPSQLDFIETSFVSFLCCQMGRDI